MRKFVFLTLFTTAVFAKSPEIEIQLHSGNESEQKGKVLIQGFLKKYDLEKYIFTKKIIIQSMVIPHSHPVLTLNTRLIDQPDRYLSTFIHEQIHWFFDGANSKKTDKFIEDIKKKFPKIPDNKESGAKDEASTYLHLGVCYNEYVALSHYIGEETAKKIFETGDVYPWVNKQVLEKGKVISETLQANGLLL
jgi:hypothetical protein